MFENTPPQGVPTRGPQPGAPLPPIAGSRPNPTVSTVISPEGMGALPPMPPMQQRYAIPPKKGGRGKTILLIVAGVIVIVGAAIAIGAFFFPPTASNINATTNTNTVANANTNVNRANTNRVNANTNTTANTNTVANANTNTSNTNVANTNTSGNANTTLNSNVNATSNTNALTNSTSNTNSVTKPASYTLDSDGDSLNDYLEGWMKTSKTNADSDGDGFNDSTEVLKSFSPLGTGKMTATGFQTYCASSVLVTQYKFPSTDVTTYCKIGGDIIANIQVMATNAQFYTDLDSQLSRSCATFGKLDAATCTGAIPALLTSYLLSGSAN